MMERRDKKSKLEKENGEERSNRKANVGGLGKRKKRGGGAAGSENESFETKPKKTTSTSTENSYNWKLGREEDREDVWFSCFPSF